MTKRKKSKLQYLMMPSIFVIVLLLLSFYWRTIFIQIGLQTLKNSETYIIYGLGICIWLACAWLLNRLIDIIIWDFIFLKRMDIAIPNLFKDVLKLLIYFFAILGIMSVVFEKSLSGVLAASGIVGLVIGLGLKNVISDILNGIALNIDKPFKIGEMIFLHDIAINMMGKVIETTWRTTRFETDSNSILVIPNSKLCTMAITNYSKNNTGDFEFPIELNADIPTQRATTILLAALKSSEGVLSKPEPKIFINNIKDNIVTYKLSYTIIPSKIKPSVAKHHIGKNIITHFQLAGIHSALPHETSFHTDLISTDHRKPPPPELFIKNINLFADFTEADQKILIENIKPISYPKDKILVDIGETGDSLFIVVEGLVRVFIKMSESEELTPVAYIATGQYFGEMSLLTGAPRSARIVAETPIVLYEITKDVMSSLFIARPELITSLSKIIAERQSKNLKHQQELLSAQEKADAENNLISQIADKIRKFFGM